MSRHQLRSTAGRRIFRAWAGACVLAAILCANSRAELPPAPEGSFSVVVIPDTQHYRGRGTKAEPKSDAEVTNPVFEAYTGWTAENLSRQRIVFVSHVGDIVDRNTPDQWKVARRAMDRLHGRVPYGISVGNHDMTSGGDSRLFQKHFPRSRFEEFAWYGGSFENKDGRTISGNNANSFQLFSAEGLDFVFLHLECNAPEDVLDWAGNVLRRHADRRAIVTTHMFLGPAKKPKTGRDYFGAPKGLMEWTKRHGKRGNSAPQMWEKCLAKHANLLMICCGDQSRTQAMHRTLRGEQGNPVHAVLSDYGAHGLRIYNFRPKENLIQVSTYNPMRGELCRETSICPASSQHQFTLPYRMWPKPKVQAGRSPN